MMKAKQQKTYRIEKDPLGEKEIPVDVLYGVQTARAIENYQISSLRIHPQFYRAYAEIKRAAAGANMEIGKLEQRKGKAIVKAASEIIAGTHAAEFDLDVFQAGAGTSYNMNINEVIANRGLEILGRARGDYESINPNDHVNKGQSTNDVMPTAMRVASIRGLRPLVEALRELETSFSKKAREFADLDK